MLVALMVFPLGTSFSQKPPPTPRSSPVTIRGEIVSRLYESESGGFKIAFPYTPRIETTPIDAVFGKSEITTYTLPTALATYGVVILDFPTDLTDLLDLNYRFDQLRDAQAAQMKARVMSDAELNFGTRYGRESVIESDSVTMSLRAIAAGPRLFVVSVATPGRLSQQTGSSLAGNQARIKRFFDSFEITKVPVSAQKRVELPEDFGLSFGDNSLRSDFFGITMSLPAGWTVLNNTQVDEFLAIGRDSALRVGKTSVEHFAPGRIRMLTIVSKGDPEVEILHASMTFMAERVPFPTFLPKHLTDAYVANFLSDAEKVTKSSTDIVLGGTDFVWVETHDSSSGAYKRLFVTNRKGISFQVVLTYIDPKDLAEMMVSMNSLKFNGD